MYSYEDQIRAVKLYIKLGKRTGPTIRKLGYPTKNLLKGWYREYEQSLDLQVGYVRARKYSDEQKRVAVQHYLDHDHCMGSTIKALGYPRREVLTAWIDAQQPGYVIALWGELRRYTPPKPKECGGNRTIHRKASAQEIAQKLAVGGPMLYNWENQLLDREVPASMKRHNDSRVSRILCKRQLS